MSHKDKPQNTQNRAPVEGEGSRSADEEYRRRTKAFVESGKVEESAQEAKRAVDSEEGEELRRAEHEGRSHAAEEDPEVVLDRRKKGVTPED